MRSHRRAVRLDSPIVPPGLTGPSRIAGPSQNLRSAARPSDFGALPRPLRGGFAAQRQIATLEEALTRLSKAGDAGP
ncbi:hypothetical protein [Rhodospirillum sp. A1_3_36]|uniref:hypothetical protein n=1 Tax=Rhodospirillum sp. A1_3_36 TaxID=3391666 RepID=UPI0039A6F5C9